MGHPDERTSVRRGVQAAAVNNSQAFGYSITITASFGVLSAERGSPGVGSVMLFALAAVLAFSLVDAVLSHGYQETVEIEPRRVLLLGTSLDVISVGGAVGLAALTGGVLHHGVAWPVGAFLASLVYVLTQGLELAIADRLIRG